MLSVRGLEKIPTPEPRKSYTISLKAAGEARVLGIMGYLNKPEDWIYRICITAKACERHVQLGDA